MQCSYVSGNHAHLVIHSEYIVLSTVSALESLNRYAGSKVLPVNSVE